MGWYRYRRMTGETRPGKEKEKMAMGLNRRRRQFGRLRLQQDEEVDHLRASPLVACA